MSGVAASPPDLITGTMDGAAYGFFGRKGGVSAAPYDTLNCGPGSGDDPDQVEENRRRCVSTLSDGRVAGLFTGYQIHSGDAVFIETAGGERPKADGFVTDRTGLALGILTADCMPVLFCDRQAGLIGAAHAGWRGALGGVLEATVALMVERGADPARIVAMIGPCLRPPLFQVGEDLVAAFTDKYPVSTRYFTAEPETPGKYQFDSVGFVLWRLAEAGLDRDRIVDTGANTLAEPERWFSYRSAGRNGEADYGRNLSAIML